MRVILTVLGGRHQGQVYTFVGQESFVVGRAKKALFRLPKKDKYISRNHFVVEVNPPYCRLIDLQSRNGTFVNDQRIQQVDLCHEDIIRIGRSLLQVRLEDVPEVDAGVSPTEELAGLAHLDPLPDHVPVALTPIPLLNSTPFEPS